MLPKLMGSSVIVLQWNPVKLYGSRTSADDDWARIST